MHLPREACSNTERQESGLMSASVSLYALSAVIELWLAIMLFFASRAVHDEGRRWSALMAIGLGVNGARSALLASGIGNVPMGAPVNIWTGTLGVLTLGFVTTALIDYVGLRGISARRLTTLGGIVLAFLVLALPLGLLHRGDGWAIGAAFGLSWVALAVYAWLRERTAGHALVIIALATFPCTVIAIRLRAVPLDLLAIAEIVPLACIGITVLTTGLIRAAALARREAVRTGQALAQREQAQADLKVANDTLEQRVALRTAELEETIEGLDSFNRSVSHDLRGPLGGIVGVAKIAREQIAAGNDAEADRILAAIVRQGETSVALVGALLALARAGNAQPRRSTVDVAGVVREVVEFLREQRPMMPRITVLALPSIEADPELLRQVFVNLITNACKFSADSDPPYIEVGHRQTAPGPAFFVRDNGVGFSEGQALQLFKPFQRLNGSRYEGFGVGLSIARRIVNHHGGRIWADGIEGVGATFWFTFSHQQPS